MEEDDIPDSRVFVNGLPPHYTSEQLGAHFAGRYQITDSVVLPGRRIGFVGFRNYTLAKNAVKYFDKSYIRMSKISVEIAKPVDFHREVNAEPELASKSRDASQSLPQSTPLGATNTSDSKSSFTPYSPLTVKLSNKRKRPESEEQSKEMKEYMEVIQPKSKSTWGNKESTEQMVPHKTQDNKEFIDETENWTDKKKKKSKRKESDEELPGVIATADISETEKKRRKKERRKMRIQLEAHGKKPDDENGAEDKEARKKRKAERKLKILTAETNVEGGVQPLDDGDDTSSVEVAKTDHIQPSEPRSDNDWLRGKTSRVLDLVDSTEHISGQNDVRHTDALERIDSGEGDANLEPDLTAKATHAETAILNPPTSTTVTVPNGRLFVRNLPFSATEADLEAALAKYGSIVEVHVIKDFRSSSSKGVAFVQFAEPEAAESALHLLDGKTFQGRLLHILPASDKKASQLDDFTLSKLPLKKQKTIKQKQNAANSSFSWNSLYMNPDAVLSSVADRLGVSKSEVLDATSSDAAVKQALAETNTIRDTKTFLKNNGINIDAFKGVRRDETTILLKNFSFGTTANDLRGLLEPFGSVTKLLLPPTGTMAIAQYEDKHMTAKALKHLAYRNFKGSVLFLEKAPDGIFDITKSPKNSQDSSSAIASENTARGSTASDNPENTSATVFVRNLNFTTTTSRLAQVFNPLPGYLNATVKTRTDPKRPGKILSMGFGFVEFNNKDQAAAAITAMNDYKLDGHELLVKPSIKVLDAAEDTRNADRAKKAEKKTKIIIKNLPFEASKKDIKALFGAYGQLRTVRVPKKFDSSLRGFAFAEFVTAREAENAMEALTNTHLLGRRLVLDFAAGDAVDPEKEIQALERKMGEQTNRIHLSEITGSARRKFNAEARDGDDPL